MAKTKIDFHFQGQDKVPLSKEILDLLDEYDDATRAWALVEPKQQGTNVAEQPRLTKDQQMIFATYFNMRVKFITLLSKMETNNE